MFTPIEEMKWDATWKPTILFSEHGIIGTGMMFTFPSRFEEEHDYVWIVSRYEPEEGTIQYTVTSSHLDGERRQYYYRSAMLFGE